MLWFVCASFDAKYHCNVSQCVTRGPLFLRGQWKLWFIPHLSPLQLYNQSPGMLRSAVSSSWGMGLGHKGSIKQCDTFATFQTFFLFQELLNQALIFTPTVFVRGTHLQPYGFFISANRIVQSMQTGRCPDTTWEARRLSDLTAQITYSYRWLCKWLSFFSCTGLSLSKPKLTSYLSEHTAT